ncbi:MAG: chemotaxis response regulator protein-glutamate methylesterase [Candidatus Eisenbacteria bacterium]|nr:chemotaxis response regulator protein-glutamate methylesterase [Candidatus Eisenbacteria bacterium]
MAKIRVLIVDDAVVVRKILTDVLASDPDIEVVGVAANGSIAVQKIPQVNPDLVTLDLEMPEMDGLETLTEIRRLYPKLPVLLFSTLTERGAASTLDGLSRGASDYVTKPSNVGSVQLAMQRIREDMIPKVKSLCPGRAMSAAPPPAVAKAERPVLPTRTPVSTPAVRGGGRPQILAIGCSTGGPNALAAMLPCLPGDLPIPVVLVQHMPPLFTRLLAERLDDKCALKVREAAEGDIISPGGIWIAPGDFHLELRSGAGGQKTVHLQQNPPENSCRPAVDVMFRSVAAQYGSHVLGVVLTGMGQDGLRGSEVIKEAGGEIWVQDEASSVVWGMPGFVARAGLASRVLPLDQIGTELGRFLSRAAA